MNQLSLFKCCTSCNQEKPSSEFYKMTKMNDGLAARCKKCQSQDAKERYKDPAQKKKNIEAATKWHREHRELSLLRMKKWRRENKKN